MSLFTEIKSHEDAVKAIYLDSKGIPTIGVGFNLREEEVLEAILEQFNYSTTSLSETDFNALKISLEAIFRKEWTESNKDDRIKEVNDVLKIYQADDKRLDNSIPEETFVFPDDTSSMEAVFNDILPTYQKLAIDGLDNNLDGDRAAAQAVFDGLSDRRKAALISLTFNGGSPMVGPSLSKALKDKDWAEAYYEIAYSSNSNTVNGEKVRINGLHNRRLKEASAMIEGISIADKQKLYEKLYEKRAEITKYIDELQADKTNNVYEPITKTRRDELFAALNDQMTTLTAELAAENIEVIAYTFKSAIDDSGNPGDGGSGDNGSGDNGSGDNGSGDNGSGDNGSGDNGSGDNGSGDNGSGDNGSGDNGSGDNGSGDTGSGDNGSGDNGSGDTGSGDTGSGEEPNPTITTEVFSGGIDKNNGGDGDGIDDNLIASDDAVFNEFTGLMTFTSNGVGKLVIDTQKSDVSYTSQNGYIDYIKITDQNRNTTEFTFNTVTGEVTRLTTVFDNSSKEDLLAPISIQTPAPNPASPIILDLDGDGVETVGLMANIHFDHNGDGFKELTGFVAADDGLLVRDLNGDGVINSGKELFGDQTLLASGLKASNGFEALAELDSNGDGVIDVNDESFGELRIFQDLDQDGETDEGELLSLTEAGVESLSISYTNQTFIDEFGNEHRQVGSYTNNAGIKITMTDVWFNQNPAESEYSTIETSYTIASLPDALGSGKARSLHQAMAQDETGELQSLVTQFVTASSRAEREPLLEKIIFAWTGQTGEQRPYYPSHIDARKIGALETFYGFDLPRPGGTGHNYGLAYEEVFRNWSDTVFYQLAAQSHLKPFFKEIDWSKNAVTGVWEGDFNRVVNNLFDYVEANHATNLSTVNTLLDFVQATRGVNPYNKVSIEQLHDAVEQFIRTEDISGYSPETLGIVYDLTSGRAIPTEGNDKIQGNENNNYLFGLGGDDWIFAGAGNDFLGGGLGNDELNAGSGNDILDGGSGNDRLEGGLGSDTYIWGYGSGNDQIWNFGYSLSEDNSDIDKLVFKQGVTASDLTWVRDGDDLKITLNSSGETLRIKFHFNEEYIDYKLKVVELADGTVLDLDSIEKEIHTITGTEGNEWLHGGEFSEFLFGLGGGDNLYAKEGDDVLDGGAGSDRLYGGEGDDLLDGGTGSDYLQGDEGNDSYFWGIGSGNDTINDYSSADQSNSRHIDKLIFKAGITANDLIWTRGIDDLLVTIKSTGETLSIKNHVTYDGYQIESVELADGTVLDLASIEKGLNTPKGTEGADYLHGHRNDDVLKGLGGDDHLIGYGGDDILDGGAGDDELEGRGGSDTYLWGAGSGNDTITNFSIDSHSSTDDFDKLLFTEGISHNDLTWSRDGDDLKVMLNSSGETLRVVFYFARGAWELDAFVLADGTILDRAAIEEAAVENINLVKGTGDDDSIYTTESDEVILGLHGNDRLYGRAGDDILDGGAGNDRLKGQIGNDKLDGGVGNDDLYGGAGNDIYYWGLGSGNDRIYNHDKWSPGDASDIDKLVFKAGISASDLVWSQDGNDLRVTLVSSGETLSIKNHFDPEFSDSKIKVVELADGTVLDLASIEGSVTDASNVVMGTEAGESIYTSDPDEVLWV